MSVRWQKKKDCGFVELNNHPVNAINLDIRKGLIDAVKWAEEERVKRVILSGVGRAFAAGADTKEFDHLAEAPHLPDVIDRIENSNIPWIAALHGAVLGGGAELALGCRYRIARADASIGFPEVILGIVPGAGGTQRLPRLVGCYEALKMIPTGKFVTGSKAFTIGLVDEVSDSPINAASCVNLQTLNSIVPVSKRVALASKKAHYEAAKKSVTKRMRGQEAPLAALALIKTAQTASLKQGMKKERAKFLELRGSPKSRALRHIFFAERAAKIPENLRPILKTPEHITIIGGGTMGASIAFAFLNAGLSVLILEADRKGVFRAGKTVEKIIASSLSRGHIDFQSAEDQRARIKVTSENVDLIKTDLLIEAIFEDLEAKKKILQEVEPRLRSDAIIATNTSYLNPNIISNSLNDPKRLVGLHFFAPAHVMKLLEIVKGDKSSPSAMAMGFSVAKLLKKIPVIAGVCDGFIGNRILTSYRDAADAVLVEGSTPWEIDKAMVNFGYAMGPYETQDLSGLDIAYANRRRQDETRDPARRYIPIADQLVLQNRLGKKTGVGWYRYSKAGAKEIDPFVEIIICKEAQAKKITRRPIPEEEIQKRLLLAMINEACKVMYEGIARCASDIDLILIHGYGFARWRGGLMYFADQLGPSHILSELEKLCDEDPVFWKPSQLIIECAKKRKNFGSYNS